MAWIRKLLLAAVVLGIVGAIALVMLLQRRGTEGFRIETRPVAPVGVTDAQLLREFAKPQDGLPHTAYESAFRYLLEGYFAYRSPAGALVHYPGLKSNNGRVSDGIEGFARMLPVAAAWLASGRPDSLALGGRTVSLSQSFAEGLVAGTDPAGPEYWGDPRDYDQRIVEAADVALGLWLSRDHVWKRLNDAQRKAVVKWLERTVQVETFDGNWELFPIVVQRVLKALGIDTSAYDERMKTRYMHFKATSYRGNGFFYDPPHGFDYYNSWSIHYELFWLDRIDPDFDPQFIRKVNGELAGFLSHLFGPKGYPLMGRSSCYRLAAPTALVTATALAPDVVSPGVAMRAMDLTWSYFVERGAFRDGNVTQGFCGTNPELMAAYSGPASCLWAVRSLVTAMVLDNGSNRLLDVARAKLPVEVADFTVSNPTAGWTIKGERASGDVTIELPANPAGQDAPLARYGLSRQLLEWVMNKPMRPDNMDKLYSRHAYSTRQQAVACEKTGG